MSVAIIYYNVKGGEIAHKLKCSIDNSTIYDGFTSELFYGHRALIFICSVGIAVRQISGLVKDKYADPAVLCIDSNCNYVIPILSGHIGGANELSKELSTILGCKAVITTQSDNENLWSLDLLSSKFNWRTNLFGCDMNGAISRFVNREKCAIYLEYKDFGTKYLKRDIPTHVSLLDRLDLGKIKMEGYSLLIIVSPHIYDFSEIVDHTAVISFIPKLFHLGVGCRKDADSKGVVDYLKKQVEEKGIYFDSIASLSTIDIKRDEPLILDILSQLPTSTFKLFSSQELSKISVPNPSKRVLERVSTPSVSEASALLASNGGNMIIEKQCASLSQGADFTFALAQEWDTNWRGHIEFVGAGPGDPELISLKGKRYLESADLILYAGSLVPKELTNYAKEGAIVKSSADMDLIEQVLLMKEFYNRGELVVRLHTGDPCIFGAIQEQMNLLDQDNIEYSITPGISSFLAAAAQLKSQFTIPERVQTIILTRGPGRTPVPERESLSMLARSRSTMCIFLSASIAKDVQNQLLEHYPVDTPVAVCYKLTWKDQKIYRGKLCDLAKIIQDNNLTLTTLIVVGEAIDNRGGLSKLYSNEFTHLFRESRNN